MDLVSGMFPFINFTTIKLAILAVAGALCAVSALVLACYLILEQLYGRPIRRGSKLGGRGGEYRIYDHNGIKLVYSKNEKGRDDYYVHEINGVTVVANENGIAALKKAGMIDSSGHDYEFDREVQRRLEDVEAEGGP